MSDHCRHWNYNNNVNSSNKKSKRRKQIGRKMRNKNRRRRRGGSCIFGINTVGYLLLKISFSKELVKQVDVKTLD
jgi:hypothetical protein